MGRGMPVTAFVTFDSEEARQACKQAYTPRSVTQACNLVRRQACLRTANTAKPLPEKYLGAQLRIKEVRTHSARASKCGAQRDASRTARARGSMGRRAGGQAGRQAGVPVGRSAPRCAQLAGVSRARRPTR
jgi:hypothetical protein